MDMGRALFPAFTASQNSLSVQGKGGPALLLSPKNTGLLKKDEEEQTVLVPPYINSLLPVGAADLLMYYKDLQGASYLCEQLLDPLLHLQSMAILQRQTLVNKNCLSTGM